MSITNRSLATKLAGLCVGALFGVAIAVSPAVSQAQAPTATIPLLTTQFGLERLAPGVISAQSDFVLDDSLSITVEVIANIGGLAVSIVGPGGEVVDEDTVFGFGGEFGTYEADPNPDALLVPPTFTPGFHYLFTFPSLGAGSYSVHFQADPALAEEVAVITQVLTDSLLGAALIATETTISLGESLVLTAPIFDGDQAVAGANVSVTVRPEADPSASTTLALLDDGADGDDLAGDGLYSVVVTPSLLGEHSAVAEVTGVSAGGLQFARAVATDFTVLPVRGKITGQLNDSGVDDNANGLIDRVLIDIETEITEPGDYLVFVHLETAAGERLVRRANANLMAGLRDVTVAFEALAFRRLGEDGPFDIALIELLFDGADGPELADRLRDAGQTQAYLLSQFERPAFALTGVTSDQGIDDTGDGFFDRLVVGVEAEVSVAGFYTWTLRLTDPDFNPIDAAALSGFLDQGLNNLEVSFDGMAILTAGADGPYLLRDLAVTGPVAFAALEVGETQAFLANQFGMPRIEVAIDIKPGTAVNAINLGSEGIVRVAILTTAEAAGEAVTFDAADVEPSTVTLAGAMARVKGQSGMIGSLKDVDGDGDLDLELQFDTVDLQLTEADTSALLEGSTTDGRAITGTDSIIVVPAS